MAIVALAAFLAMLNYIYMYKRVKPSSSVGSSSSGDSKGDLNSDSKSNPSGNPSDLNNPKSNPSNPSPSAKSNPSDTKSNPNGNAKSMFDTETTLDKVTVDGVPPYSYGYTSIKDDEQKPFIQQ